MNELFFIFFFNNFVFNLSFNEDPVNFLNHLLNPYLFDIVGLSSR
jgi:hypothetical protein